MPEVGVSTDLALPPSSWNATAMGKVEFAIGADGTGVAYRDLGGYGPAIVYVTGAFEPVELADEDPTYRRFLDGLVAIGRTIMLDRRGIGASDDPDWEQSIDEQWADDVITVMDAAGVVDATLVTYNFGSLAAVVAAATQPDRVQRLVLLNPVPADDESREALTAFMREIQGAFERDVDVGEHMLRVTHPSRADEPGFREFWDRAGRAGASASTVQRIQRNRADVDFDYQGWVARVESPTLVMYRKDAVPDLVAGHGALVAALSDATLVRLSGADISPMAGDVDEVVAEISRFVLGEYRAAAPERQMLAVLFTDLVGSTEQLVGAGDARWRSVLDRHDQVVKAALGRHGGRLVKTTGDGILATFDGASRALDGAIALRAALGELGLGVRMGVHVGEVELRGDDVAGVAVHAAARIMGQASAGEVLTSNVVPILSAGGNHGFDPRGKIALKGFDDDWEVYALAGN